MFKLTYVVLDGYCAIGQSYNEHCHNENEDCDHMDPNSFGCIVFKGCRHAKYSQMFVGREVDSFEFIKHEKDENGTLIIDGEEIICRFLTVDGELVGGEVVERMETA